MLRGRAGGARIRAPRNLSQQANQQDFEDTWAKLSGAFTQIHTKQTSEISFEELYRGAYGLVLKKRGEELYKRVIEFEKRWLTNSVQQEARALLTPELLIPTVSTSDGEKRAAGERFLRGVKQHFIDQDVCMGMLSDVLLYLDRVYCTDRQAPKIYSSAMRLFREQVLKARIDVDKTVLDIVIRTMLDHIKMERDGDVIDKSLLKACTHMLEGLYVGSVETDDQRLYHEVFEREFLQKSEDYYERESEKMLRDSDAGAYCRKAKQRLTEELDRCGSTLSEASKPQIEKVVLNTLIHNRLPELISMDTGVEFMINNDRLDELRLVDELSGRVDPQRKHLIEAIQKRIVAIGQEINTTATNPPQEGDQQNSAVQQTSSALRWVEEILALKDKFDKIWAVAFDKDKSMQTAITRAFTRFINSSTFTRGSEYVSLFIDDNMRKGIRDKTEQEVDIVLDKAITLLRYIEDKDMFERYYKKHLSKRLLLNRSISTDVEKQMVGKIKIELGNAFTAKIESMFKDMDTSVDLTSQFKSHISANHNDGDAKPADLNIHLLTSQVWPNEMINTAGDNASSPDRKVIYPRVAERLIERFQLFYGQKHSGRLLTWVPTMGTADIKARFPGAKKERTHELNVSTFAMVILMLFNDIDTSESLTFSEIQARTNIPTNELIRNLQSLACVPKTRILVKSPASRDVKENDEFTYNASFTSKFLRVKVNVVANGNRVESDRERLKTEQKNDENRSFICEAAIVRIMKQRKILSHSQLVAEVIAQLTHFKPEISMIKSRIEALLERDYLERDDSDTNLYKYLA